MICELAGSAVKPEIRGDGVPVGEIDRQWVDPSKLFEMTGWKAQVGLREGLQRTIDFYREHAQALL
jgi:nucleoside-diphosphate-sugar epimerase